MTKRWKVLFGVAIALVIPALLNLIFWPNHIYWISLPGLGIITFAACMAVAYVVVAGPFILLGLAVEAVEWLNSK